MTPLSEIRQRALAYFRTSSATNVGGDSDVRQREAVQSCARRMKIEIAAEFYDAAISGADPLDQREGFTSARRKSAVLRGAAPSNPTRRCCCSLARRAGLSGRCRLGHWQINRQWSE